MYITTQKAASLLLISGMTSNTTVRHCLHRYHNQKETIIFLFNIVVHKHTHTQHTHTHTHTHNTHIHTHTHTVMYISESMVELSI